MSDYHIVTVEPALGCEDDVEVYSNPTWEFIIENKLFVLYIGKRADRMTRVDMTRLLLWIPTLKLQLRQYGFSEQLAANVALSVLATRKVVRLRLACSANV